MRHVQNYRPEQWTVLQCASVEEFIAMLVRRFYIYPFSFKCLCDHIMFGQIDQLLSFSLSTVLPFPDSGCFNWKIFIAKCEHQSDGPTKIPSVEWCQFFIFSSGFQFAPTACEHSRKMAHNEIKLCIEWVFKHHLKCHSFTRHRTKQKKNHFISFTQNLKSNQRFNETLIWSRFCGFCYWN